MKTFNVKTCMMEEKGGKFVLFKEVASLIKLPNINELIDEMPPVPCDWGCDEETATALMEYGAKSLYDIIIDKLKLEEK